MTLPASTWIPPSTPARASFTGQPPLLLAASYRVNIEIGGIGRLTNPEEAA